MSCDPDEYERLRGRFFPKHSIGAEREALESRIKEAEMNREQELRDYLGLWWGFETYKIEMVLNLIRRLEARPEPIKVSFNFWDMTQSISNEIDRQETELLVNEPLRRSKSVVHSEDLKGLGYNPEKKTSKRGKNIKPDKSKKHKYSQSKK